MVPRFSLPARGRWLVLALGLFVVVPACQTTSSTPLDPAARARDFSRVRLAPDLSSLSASERNMIPLLIAAAEAMDAIFWQQAYGDRSELIRSTPASALPICEIYYGPWDRLDGNRPLVDGVGEKPLGANFYPRDMTAEEFEAHLAKNPNDDEAFRSLYTVIRRRPDGRLLAIPYHEIYADEMARAATNLRAAAELAEDDGLKRYLKLRADALLSGDYLESDLAWMDMKTNRLDVVVGPIETYEDRLFGMKAAAECFVLVKDVEWSERLAVYAQHLPGLQQGLPVPPEFKTETPGRDSDLNAYDVVYVGGDANAGSKTIAINLPNDERVQLEKGTRRLQLKNSMRAKFDRILVPLADMLIAPDQRKHISFEAFFGNTMFHEVAHGLGIKNTINGKGTVREALGAEASALEEGKADVLGLYMVERLRGDGVITDGDLMDNYVTFLAGIFRSIRFGASSAHGRANLLRFNFFRRMNAFSRDDASGTYRVEPEAMRAAIESLSRKILILQGRGDGDGVRAWMEEDGAMTETLAGDLGRLAEAGIPVDIVYEQGLSVLDLGQDGSPRRP